MSLYTGNLYMMNMYNIKLVRYSYAYTGVYQKTIHAYSITITTIYVRHKLCFFLFVHEIAHKMKMDRSTLYKGVSQLQYIPSSLIVTQVNFGSTLKFYHGYCKDKRNAAVIILHLHDIQCTGIRYITMCCIRS